MTKEQKISGSSQLTTPATNNTSLNNISARLDMWTKNRQVEIERSSNNVLNEKVSEISDSEARFKTEEKLESAMEGIYRTAIAKVHEMKDANIDQERIRNAILPAIQNMNSPFAENSPLKQKFSEMHEKIFNEVDSKIIGSERVLDRNISANTSSMKI